MNDEICFIRRSTDPSDPVLRRVVMARVAMDLFNRKEKARKDEQKSIKRGINVSGDVTKTNNPHTILRC